MPPIPAVFALANQFFFLCVFCGNLPSVSRKVAETQRHARTQSVLTKLGVSSIPAARCSLHPGLRPPLLGQEGSWRF